MAQAKGDFKLIMAGRLIDGRGGPPQEQMAVLVEGKTLRAAGRRGQVKAPEGASVELFDFSDKTVLPGLVDGHTHINGFGDGRRGDDLAKCPDDILLLQSARNARVSLRAGVTTVRENGAKGRTTFSLKDAVRLGICEGPRIVICGRPLAITGGHMGYFGSEADGADELRKEVRKLIKEGADYIKITATGGSTRTSFPLLPSYTVDELRVIVSEAHRFGVLTAAHCVSTQGTINCLEAGADMIIHCVFREADGAFKFVPEVAERIGKQGAWVNPTLHVVRATVRKLERKREAEGLTPAEQATLDNFRRQFEASLDSCRRMLGMGLKVMAGSDSSWSDYPSGGFVHQLEALVDAGCTPMQAILAGTRDSAASIGVANVVGTLEPGKAADILAVDGDPSQDIRALWNVAAVFHDGQPVELPPRKC